MPGITFRSLAYTDIESLLQCFNGSFRVYYVPIQLSKEQLTDKIYAEAIDMKLSFGAFDNDELVGFILHGIDTIDNKKIAYNAGTGVLPAYRGKRITAGIYEYGLTQLKSSGIEKTLLDVIDQNIPAIKTYSRVGFITTRKMISYKGKPVCKEDPSVEIKISDSADWGLVKKLGGWKPAWQYNNNTLKRAWNNYSLLTAGLGNTIEAYCIANVKNGRIAKFAGMNGNDHRYLSALFAHLGKTIEDPLTVIHVDEAATEANSFLTAIGLEHFITSFEMEMDIL